MQTTACQGCVCQASGPKEVCQEMHLLALRRVLARSAARLLAGEALRARLTLHLHMHR